MKIWEEEKKTDREEKTRNQKFMTSFLKYRNIYTSKFYRAMFLSAEDQIILKFMQSVVHTSRGSIFLATNHEDTDIQIGLFKATGSMVACYFVSILIT